MNGLGPHPNGGTEAPCPLKAMDQLELRGRLAMFDSSFYTDRTDFKDWTCLQDHPAMSRYTDRTDYTACSVVKLCGPTGTAWKVDDV